MDDDDEFVLLLSSSSSERKRRFNIDIFSDNDFISNFRFDKDDFYLLKSYLDLPNIVHINNGLKVSGSILFFCLAIPNPISRIPTPEWQR